MEAVIINDPPSAVATRPYGLRVPWRFIDSYLLWRLRIMRTDPGRMTLGVFPPEPKFSA
jgi:hypothetical protein